jgi:hypothetical protein
MSKNTYTFQTPDHAYDLIPDPLDANLVRVKSEFKESIEDFLNTVELSGRGNDEDFQTIEIKEGCNEYDTYWYTEVSKEDLALYFQFEVRFFMGAVPEL